jgi:hypothetical protein
MAHPVLEQAGKDMADINNKVREARELIAAMKEAGEDTTGHESDLKGIEIRKTKWERMLANRGVVIPKS